MFVKCTPPLPPSSILVTGALDLRKSRNYVYTYYVSVFFFLVPIPTFFLTYLIYFQHFRQNLFSIIYEFACLCHRCVDEPCSSLQQVIRVCISGFFFSPWAAWSLLDVQYPLTPCVQFLEWVATSGALLAAIEVVEQ